MNPKDALYCNHPECGDEDGPLCYYCKNCTEIWQPMKSFILSRRYCIEGSKQNLNKLKERIILSNIK